MSEITKKMIMVYVEILHIVVNYSDQISKCCVVLMIIPAIRTSLALLVRHKKYNFPACLSSVMKKKRSVARCTIVSSSYLD